MLRLALAATLMYSATALTTTGDVISLYSYFDTAEAASAVDCQEASDGVAAGPVLGTAANLNGAKAIVLGNCYETNGLSTTTAEVPMNNAFAAVSPSGSTKYEASLGSGVVEFKFDMATADITMTAYTGTADGCTGDTTGTTAVAAETGGTVASTGETSAGWACRGALANPAPSPGIGVAPGGFNSISMGILDVATNGASARYQDARYVTVTSTDDNQVATATVDCAAANISEIAGQTTDYWPVALNDADAIPGSCSTATTATTFTGNESACLAVTDAVWTAGSGDFTKAHWALCYPTADGAGSWQLKCDSETGNLVHTTDADSTYCAFASNQTVTNIPQSISGSLGLASDTSYCIMNSATEWDSICRIPAHTATAKYFKGYFLATQGDCATQTAATSATAAENDGTKNVFMDVCYTLEADGEMPGWQGPFVTGGTGSEPIASKLSYKFTEGTTDILLNAYTTHDCSGGEFTPSPAPANGGSMTQYTDDDPAGTTLAWACQNSSVISHGGVAAGGNISMLQTAINYLTVRRHPGTAANGVGLPGVCTGANATTGVAESLTSGLILDYFRVGTSAADGCMQMNDGVSTTATVAHGYSWWCDSSDYSINYGTFHTADCSASQLGGALKFTKLAYDACSEADAADSNTTCTAAGPTTVLENPSAFVFATVNALANGAAADFGGKCLVAASNVSWEILSDSATWDAMCSAPAPSPTTATTSGAGKVAATAAAAAAAAALLL